MAETTCLTPCETVIEVPCASQTPMAAAEEAPMTGESSGQSGQQLGIPASWSGLPDVKFEEELNEAAKENEKLIASSGERETLEGFEDNAKLLEVALSGGDVNPRSALGQQYAAWLRDNPDEAETYKNLKQPGRTTQMTKEFRLRWAKTQL